MPEFDRTRDVAIAARAIIGRDQRIILVEGNYLLLNAPGWSELNRYWALSVLLSAPLDTLEKRLTDRWLNHGHDARQARARALSNDIPNARFVLENSISPDLRLE